MFYVVTSHMRWEYVDSTKKEDCWSALTAQHMTSTGASASTHTYAKKAKGGGCRPPEIRLFPAVCGPFLPAPAVGSPRTATLSMSRRRQYCAYAPKMTRQRPRSTQEAGVGRFVVPDARARNHTEQCVDGCGAVLQAWYVSDRWRAGDSHSMGGPSRRLTRHTTPARRRVCSAGKCS